MIALWMEAEDVEAVRSALSAAGHSAGRIVTEPGRRVLAIDPEVASRLPRFIFDRKG